ncbi:serine/threonine protein kinase [Rubinisphaera margarita]|uniref:serine/threonine protein kinase n=1 Tax=Rubinisphaera margarita TaxID=2909586 RepID=UPI001EE87A06|nr:serine/threonine-protein kinase [Rubinisphaera margarita]MCG6154375.1 serine/threonine protein kinase [Rubinisphaera margarita]
MATDAPVRVENEFMAAKAADIVGQLIAGGRYEIQSHVGTGSMGHVYQAYDHRLGTSVCVKIPTISRLADPDFARRFELESRFLVRLAHPQIVNIIDVGIENETPYIVMQFISGGTLLTQMQDGNGNLTPRPLKDLKHWLPSVAKALDFMHSQGCIHRDVKPANILFDDHNNAYLSDFGLSKLLMEDETQEDNRMTAKGAVVGTPNYVAPEIVLGREYDGKADQYSLAITVYEFITAMAPFEGPSASATMVNQTTKQPPPMMTFVPSLAPRVNQIVLKAMSKSPDGRYRNCEEFADALMTAVLTGNLAAANSTRSQSGISSVSGSGSTDIGRSPRFIVTKTSRAVSPGKIPCPKCEKKLLVTSAFAGQLATCSGCSGRVRISNDIQELALLEENPNYNASLHRGGESDQFKTVLKTEVFGLKLSERQANWFVGGTLLAIMFGAIIFGIRLNQESMSDQTLRETRTISREKDMSARIARIPIKAAYTPAPAENDWIKRQVSNFSNLVSVNADIQLTSNAEGGETALNLAAELIEIDPHSLNTLLSTRTTLEFERLKQQWRDNDSTEGQLFEREETIYTTPFVCLMWQDRYFEFTQRYGQLNLETVVRAAVDDADWGTLADKPDWGLFRFATPPLDDPEFGDLMLITACHQILKTDQALKSEDLMNEKVRDFLKKVDRLPVRNRTEGSVMDAMIDAAVQSGPDYADVLIMTEQAALKAIPQLEEKWKQFVQVVYLTPAPNMSRSIGITSVATDAQADGASTFLDYLLNSESMRQLAGEGLRPASAAVSPFESQVFSRYRLRGVRENAPGAVPLPGPEVVDTLRETFERIRLQ